LQSCSYITLPLDADKEPINLTKQLDIQAILGKKFTAEGNHCITFYEAENALQARVQVKDEIDKAYEGIPVKIEKGVRLAELPSLEEKVQQKRIQITFEEGKPTSVAIRKAWLLDESKAEASNEIIVFCGNPGVGKSALCNSIFQKVKFKSGIKAGRGMTTQHQGYTHENRLYIDTPGLEDVNMRLQAAVEIEEALKKDNNYKVVFVATLESGRVRMSDLTAINVVCDAIHTNFEYGLIINKASNLVIDLITRKGGLDRYLTTLHKQPLRVVMLKEDSNMKDAKNVYFLSNDENREKLLDFVNTLPASNIQKKDVNKIDVSNFEEKIQQMEERYKKAMAEQEAKYKQDKEEEEVQMKKEREEQEAKLEKIQEQMQASRKAAEAEIEKDRKEAEDKIRRIGQENEEKQQAAQAQMKKEKEEQDVQIKKMQEEMEESQRAAKAQRKKEREEQETQIKRMQEQMEASKRAAEAENKKEREEEENKRKKERKELKTKIRIIRQEAEESQRAAKAQRKEEKEKEKEKEKKRLSDQIQRMQEQMEEKQRAIEAQRNKEREEAEYRIRRIQEESEAKIRRIRQEDERYLAQLREQQPQQQEITIGPCPPRGNVARDAVFTTIGGAIGGPVGASIGLAVSKFFD
jgi:hypothetical protein